jgi:membrane-bound serine protease (ClpP class)
MDGRRSGRSRWGDEVNLAHPCRQGTQSLSVSACAVLRPPYSRRVEPVIILLVVGAILLLAESVLPGMIAGLVGACCLVAAVIEGYVRFGARTGNLILFGVLAGLVFGFWLWLKYFPNSRVAKVFISRQVVGEIGTEKPELLDQTGTALSALRPAGTAVINGKRVDVVTEGQMIDPGTPVRVVAVEGMRVVVRQFNQTPTNTTK